MFKELLDLSHVLGGQPGFPPAGFYQYSRNAPIRWVVRITPGHPPQARIVSLELPNLRPYSGRTSGISAHPFADEASYALGVGAAKGDKAQAFRNLLQKMSEAPEFTDPTLQQALGLVTRVIEKRLAASDPQYRRMKEKDWVSFIVDEGNLADCHLFEHPDVQRFWFRHLGETTSVAAQDGTVIIGECSACGIERPLAGRIPLGVKLSKPNPLISQNADAYVSRVEGPAAFKRATLSLCLKCGDAAARALNYLSNNGRYSRALITDPQKNDDLGNYHALFWLQRTSIPENPTEPIADLGALLDTIPVLMERAKEQLSQPIEAPPILKQLEDLLKIPWSAADHAATLSEEGFYLLLLSPNKGRIVVRDWIAVSLGTLRRNLRRFLDAQRIIGPDDANARVFTVPMILDALKRPKSKLADADDTRGLLRSAYLGEHPDWALLARALVRFRSALRRLDEPATSSRELSPSLRLHICAAVLKLFCLHGKEDPNDMAPLEEQSSYLCGRLLAVLEEVQRRAAGKTKLNVTLVERLFTAAAMTPGATLSMAINRAQVGHLPKLRRERRGYERMQQLLQDISGQLVARGGMPTVLDPVAQAEFALGYYKQRAVFHSVSNAAVSPEDEKGAEA